MYHRVKKTALILGFLTCFISYQGFAGGKKESPPAQVPASGQAANALDGIDNKINSITGELTKIDEDIVKIYGEIEKLKEASLETGPEDLEEGAPRDAAKTGLTVIDEDNASAGGGENNSGNSGEPVKPLKPSRSIIGGGSLKPQAVIAYVYAREKDPALDRGGIEKLINTYIREAGDEGVNADIAIAQMLHWTNNLKNRERVETCNYGGLGKIGNWNGKFPHFMSDGMTEGVRAHIQHLKAYAGETPVREIVDPRYNLVFGLGFQGMGLEQLCGYWSQNPRYGLSIGNILSDLDRHSGGL
jgi:hypothetical protein